MLRIRCGNEIWNSCLQVVYRRLLNVSDDFEVLCNTCRYCTTICIMTENSILALYLALDMAIAVI